MGKAKEFLAGIAVGIAIPVIYVLFLLFVIFCGRIFPDNFTTSNSLAGNLFGFVVTFSPIVSFFLPLYLTIRFWESKRFFSLGIILFSAVVLIMYQMALASEPLKHRLKNISLKDYMITDK